MRTTAPSPYGLPCRIPEMSVLAQQECCREFGRSQEWEGSSTHHPSAGPPTWQKAVGRRGKLLSLCPHPALGEMGSCLQEEEVFESLLSALALCLGLLWACLAAGKAIMVPPAAAAGEMCGTTPGLQRWCAGQEPCTCAGLSRGAREALIEAQLSSQCLQEPAVLFALLLQECHRVLQPAEGTQRQPCHAAPLAPKPQCIMPRTSPVVALLQRAPLVPELSDTLLVLGKLLRQPPLLRTPLPQLCFSLPCPGAGGQESLLHSCQLWGQSTGVSPPARSGGALWNADLGSPSPTLAEVVPLEPQGPVVLPQSLVLPAQLQRRLRRLAVDIPGQACAGRPPLAVSGSLPRTGCRRLCRARPPPALPQRCPVPLALLAEARRRSSCSRSRSLVQMDSSRRWRRLRISTKCSSSRSAPATAKRAVRGRNGFAICPIPSLLPCPTAEPHPADVLVPGLSLSPCSQPAFPSALQHGPYLIACGWRGALMAEPHKGAAWEGGHSKGSESQWPQGSQPGSAVPRVGRAVLGLCCSLRRGPVGLWALLGPQDMSHLRAQGKAVRTWRTTSRKAEQG